MKDDFNGVGGSYAIDERGNRVQVVAPTQDHPEGNAPRDADGKRLDTHATSAAPAPAPAESNPAPEAASVSRIGRRVQAADKGGES